MIILTKSSLLGEIAKWAVRQSPYNNPQDLNIVLDKMKKICIPYEELECLNFEDKYALDNFLNKHLLEIEEVKKWNEPKNDIKAKVVFTSRFNDIDSDDDFIDLDALVRNITNSLVKEDNEEKEWCQKRLL